MDWLGVEHKQGREAAQLSLFRMKTDSEVALLVLQQLALKISVAG